MPATSTWRSGDKQLTQKIKPPVNLKVVISLVVLFCACSLVLFTFNPSTSARRIASEIVTFKEPVPLELEFVRGSQKSEYYSQIVMHDKESGLNIYFGRRPTPQNESPDMEDSQYETDKIKVVNWVEQGTYEAKLFGKPVQVVQALKTTSAGPDTHVDRIIVNQPDNISFFFEAYSPDQKPVDKVRLQQILDSFAALVEPHK